MKLKKKDDALGTLNEIEIPFKFEHGKLFLLRDACYEISGILEKRRVDQKQDVPASHSQGINSMNTISMEEAECKLIKAHTNEEGDEAQVIADRGLDVGSSFCKDGGDEFAYVSLNALLVQTSLDGEISRSTDWTNSSKFFGLGIWTDLIAAISHEAPKLRIHVKMIEFREQLLATVLSYFIKYLVQASLQINEGGMKKEISAQSFETPSIMEDDINLVVQGAQMATLNTSENNVCLTQEKIKADINSSDSSKEGSYNLLPDEIENRLKMLKEPEISLKEGSNSILMEESNVTEETLIEEQIFQSIREEIQESCQSSGKNEIGDWFVDRCDKEEICLVVNPGYGGSRKMSFMQTDVWAILRYQLVFSSDVQKNKHHLRLLINNRPVPSDLVQPVLTRSLKKGVFNLLYNLLILRPCFGSFNPELVETFKQGTTHPGHGSSESCTDNRFKTAGRLLDANFIGSSQNGRTYAGTIRSTDCKVIAESRISDTCQACSYLLGLTINRSVLNSPVVTESSKVFLTSKTENGFESEKTVDQSKAEKEIVKPSLNQTGCGDDMKNNPRKVEGEGEKTLRCRSKCDDERSPSPIESSKALTDNERKNDDGLKRKDNAPQDIHIRRSSASCKVCHVILEHGNYTLPYKILFI